MNLIDIILLGIALGIDCFLASFSQGLIFEKRRTINSLKLAAVMGFFQGTMPIIGYIGADTLFEYIYTISKWIVFAIFIALGIKFILESFAPKKELIQCIGIKCLIGLGIGTSIDALVSGATLRLTHSNLIISCLIIGFVSFVMSLIGFWGGNRIKNICPKCLESIGGIILIVLAIKTIL